MERIGKSLREAPRDALISRYSDKYNAEMFGIHRTMNTLGVIIGVFLAYVFVEQYSFNQIFMFSALIGAFSIIPLFFVYEKSNLRIDVKKAIGNDAKIRKFFAISILFYIGSISYIFLVIFSSLLFGENAILLYLLFNIIYMFFSIPSGKVADKIGKLKVISLGFLIFSFSMLSFILNNFYSIIAGFALYGFSYALIEGNKSSLISQLSNGNTRVFGIYYTITGIATIIGNTLFGFLWTYGTFYAFAIAFILTIFSFFLSQLWKKDLNIRGKI